MQIENIVWVAQYQSVHLQCRVRLYPNHIDSIVSIVRIVSTGVKMSLGNID